MKRRIVTILLVLIAIIGVNLFFFKLQQTEDFVSSYVDFNNEYYLNGLIFDVSKTKEKLKIEINNLNNESVDLFNYAIKDNDSSEITKIFDSKINSFQSLEKSINLDINEENFLIIYNDGENELVAKEIDEALITNYNDCKNSRDFDYSNNEGITDEINKLKMYLNNYKCSIVYEELNSDFGINYDSNKIYYGASLIKLSEALYIFDKVSEGEVSLQEKIQFSKKYYQYGGTQILENKLNDELTIENILYYMLTFSDNAAHFMIFDYIGADNLIAYQKSLGIGNPYNNSDRFGNQKASDMNIYLKHAYELISKNDNNAKLLKSYMVNNYENFIDLNDGIEVGHKYGEVEYFFHDVGITFTNNPYFLSVLTHYGVDDGSILVKNIATKVRDIHNKYEDEKNNFCLSSTFAD